MKKINLLLGVILLSTGIGFGQSVTITPGTTTTESIEPFLEIKRLKNNSSNGATLQTFRSRGTGVTDNNLVTGSELFRIQSRGYDGANFKIGAVMSFEASQTWTPSALGTDFRLRLTMPNKTIPSEWLTVKGTGDVGLGNSVPGAKLDISNLSTNDDYPSLRLLHLASGFNRIAFETLGKTGNFVIASKIETNASDSRLHLYSKDAPVGNVLSITGDGKIIHEGYTRLGSPASDAPLIKMKKITGTTASTEGASVNIPHGLGAHKILAVDIHVNYATTAYMGNSHLRFDDYQFDYIHDNVNIRVYNVAGNSANILSKPVTILITYEE